MAEHTRTDLIEAVKTAAKGEKCISREEFRRRTGLSLHYVYKLFPEGGWKEVCLAAGLSTDLFREALTDEEILTEYNRAVKELGRIPTWNLFDWKSKISSDAIRKRFGG